MLLIPEIPSGNSFSKRGFSSTSSDGGGSTVGISSAGMTVDTDGISSAVSEAVSSEDVSELVPQPNPIQPKSPRI